jgi:type II secretory pathway component GspD/PulD (secretin)
MKPFPRLGRSLPWALTFAMGVSPAWNRSWSQDKPATPEAASPAPAAPVTRPEVPNEPVNPEELEIRPDEQGRIRFQFQGQPWQAVVEWLAEVSHLSLDWQELPPGFLNLHTQQTYSLEEARDLINRHLLDRGFTLLKHGEVLSVAKISRIDPSLVPRLEPDELGEALPHEFVRVTFPLDWITAEVAVEDLKPLVSPNGKLTTIKSSNHLEAMDAVANLRDIRRLVGDPNSPRGPRRQVKQFVLEHTKAEEVRDQLRRLLGIDRGTSTASAADPGVIMQQMATYMKQAGMDPGQLAKARSAPPPPVHIVTNLRDNSLLVNAPADQMAIVAEAVKVLDVPNDRSKSLLRNNSRVQTYPLQSADPDNILKLIQDLGDLEPETRLQVDRKKRAIVAHASLIDHLTIRTLVEKLDGTARSLKVIPLRKLEAHEVAGSLNLVIGGGAAATRVSTRDAEDESKRFRVVADGQLNRLMLWVSDEELVEVRRLLVELGEPEDADAPADTAVRVLESTDPEQMDTLLRRLQAEWRELLPNRLELGPGVELPRVKNEDEGQSKATRKPSRSARQAKPVPAQEARREEPESEPAAAVKLTALRPVMLPESAEKDAGAAAARPGELPPVRVDRDSLGRWILRSDDPEALAKLQKLFEQSKPERENFHVFKMKNKSTWAGTIAENLRLFFDERRKAEEKRLGDTSVARWYDPSQSKWIDTPRQDPATALKKLRMPPKFIVDEESNTILTLEADSEQIAAAQKFIDLYDTPEAVESPIVRVTRLVPVSFANPKQVSDTLKDVYKDLLVSNELAAYSAATKKKRNVEPTYVLESGAGKGASNSLLRFRGQLALGIDESSSSIVVSAPSALADMVEETIKALDEAARSNRPKVQVFSLKKGIDAAEVQKRLAQALNKK